MADDRCGVCGATPPAGARFCHSCGAPMGTAVVALDEGPLDRRAGRSDSAETVSSRKAPRALVLLVVAGFAALAGWALLSGSPDDDQPADAEEEAQPEETPTPAPTATAEPTEAVEPTSTRADLVEPIFELDGHIPVDIVEFGDDVILFTVESGALGLSFLNPPGGLVAWRYDPTADTFTEVSQPLTDDQVFGGATTTGDEMLIAGLDAEGDPTLWRSADGATWASEAMSTETLEVGQRFEIAGVAAFEDTIVVTGSIVADLRPIDEAIPQEVKDLVPNVGFAMDAGDTVRLTGPLGLPIYELSLTEIGIEPGTIFGGPIGLEENGRVWAHTDGEWTGRIDDAMRWAPTVLPNRDGVVANSFGRSDAVLSFSGDGLTWRDEPSRVQAFAMTSWRGDLAVASWQDVYAVNLRGDWTPLELTPALGRSEENQLTVIDASDAILAVAGTPGRGLPTNEDPGAVLVAAEGGSIRYAPTTGTLVLRLDDGTDVTFPRGVPSSDERIDVDLATGEVHFLDEAGARLASTTLDDLARLEEAAYDESAGPPSTLLLAITDGTGWTIDRRIGAGWPMAVEVTDSRIFLLAVPDIGSEPRDRTAPSAVVYAGTLDR